MESNWRFNVWDQGLFGAGFKLAARVSGSPILWVVAFDFTLGGAIGYIDVNPFSGEWGFIFPIQYFTGRFPYGVPVVSD